MPIDAKSIADFLQRRGQKLPDVKALSAEQCLQRIERLTGVTPYFKTEPRLAQLHGLVVGLELERCLLLFDMRTGKTKAALDWASHLALSDRWQGRGMIIVPSPVITNVWVTQAEQHSFLRVKAVTTTKIEDLLQALDDDELDLVVIAWSSLQGMFTVKRETRATKKKAARAKLYPDYELLDLVSEVIELLIVDEIHTAKNHDSLRFQIAAGLNTKSRFFMGLTGTAWGRSPFAAWAQAYLTDRGRTLGRNYFFYEAAFGKKTVITKEKKIILEDGTEEIVSQERKAFVFDKDKLPILQMKLASIALSYKHKEQGKGVFEGVVSLNIKGDQRKAYIDAINSVIKQDDVVKSVNNVFVRLRQIASGFLPFTDEFGINHMLEYNDNIKREWLVDFIAELDPSIKCVLFHEFTHTGQMICNVLAEAKVTHSWLYGKTKDRAGAIRQFEHGDAQVIVVQAASGGMGIELLKADYQCYYEAPLSAITRSQSERRAQGEARGGRILLIDDLVCAPVERKILGMTREGKDMLKELYKDPRGFMDSLKL